MSIERRWHIVREDLRPVSALDSVTVAPIATLVESLPERTQG
jgi:hypothetical protein